MNKDVFRKLRQMLMEELDLSRELSDKEILDVIDELILNQIKRCPSCAERKGTASSGTVLFCPQTGCASGTGG